MAEDRLPQIETVADLAALGRVLECALERKYEALAERMERHGRKATAALFRRLAEAKRAHARAFEDRAARQGLAPRPDDAEIEETAGRLLRLFGDPRPRDIHEDAERDLWAQDPYLSSPYRALAYAVRDTERAFRLYSYLASAAAAPEAREMAEGLATEELDHANRLRAERRRAYHAERAKGPRAELPSPRLVEGLADLLAVAAAVESRLAEMLAEEADREPALAPLARERAALAQSLDDERAAAAVAPRPAIQEALAAWRAAEARPPVAAAADPLARLHATAERAFAFYDGVFARAPDEAVMLKAQALSRAALDLITALAGLSSRTA